MYQYIVQDLQSKIEKIQQIPHNEPFNKNKKFILEKFLRKKNWERERERWKKGTCLFIVKSYR